MATYGEAGKFAKIGMWPATATSQHDPVYIHGDDKLILVQNIPVTIRRNQQRFNGWKVGRQGWSDLPRFPGGHLLRLSLALGADRQSIN